jgi:hypothetical protein
VACCHQTLKFHNSEVTETRPLCAKLDAGKNLPVSSKMWSNFFYKGGQATKIKLKTEKDAVPLWPLFLPTLSSSPISKKNKINNQTTASKKIRDKNQSINLTIEN